MCVFSMVHDYYGPQIPEWVPNTTIGTSGFIVTTPNNVIITQKEIDDVRQLIADFRTAMAAALTVDRLTNQPDCLDPAKAGLIERIERLEALVEQLTDQNRKLKEVLG